MTDIPAEVRERRLSELSTASPDAIWFLAPDGAIVWSNGTADEIGGHPGTAFVSLLDGESAQRFTSTVLSAARHNGSWTGDLVVRSWQRTFPAAVRAQAHHDDAGAVREISLVVRDVSREQQAEAVLRDQARRDALTGLPNRAEFVERLTLALHRAFVHHTNVAVLFCDLDGFKAVNDGFGHDAGDELLVAVAGRLVAGVGIHDVVARFGGDEFVVLLADVADADAACGVAQRLVDAVGQPVRLSMASVGVGASIGVALGNVSTADADSLMNQADAAMYVAKRRGKRRVQRFDAELAEQFRVRARLHDDIDSGLHSGAFRVVYTPVVHATDGSLHSFEAGLRWDHDEFGELGPADFVAIAKERSLMLRLGGIVVDDAARRAEQWNSARDEVRTVWLTVGGQELLAGGFLAMVADAVDAAGVGPQRLGVEAPYRAVARHPDEATRVLQALHWMGVRIAIDDVGAEPVAAEHLLRCSADTIKLDRRMVSSLGESAEAVGSLAALSAIGRALGMQVIAKGVTTAAQIELVQEFGCTAVQGDVVAPALRPEAVDHVLAVGRSAAVPWPTTPVLRVALSPSQIAERMLRLRADLRRVA